MSELDICFVRSTSGYQMEEFFHSSIQYSVFGDMILFSKFLADLVQNNKKICHLNSNHDHDSPSSYIIDNSIMCPRIIVTERPVRVGLTKRMEIVFSGNCNAYQELLNQIRKLFLSTNDEVTHASPKLDGIFDKVITPFTVGLVFAEGDGVKYSDTADRKLVFPEELNYMYLVEESDLERIVALNEFKERILSWIDKIYE